MWRIIYLNLKNGEIGHKGGFHNDKQADEWANKEKQAGNIMPLKLAVWSELIQCFRVVEEY